MFVQLLPDEEFVDLFACGGGTSEGWFKATGTHPYVAINHDPEAVAMHQVNHPTTKHYCKSVYEVSPAEATSGKKVGALWASPDCKHFSRAKGGVPVKQNIRDLAWIVTEWARRKRPRIIFLENVEEFADWGPLIRDPINPQILKPCKDRKGQTFNHFVNTLRRFGYKVEWRSLRACDYGAPTIRKRLFLIARRDGKPIVWPEKTHGHGLLPYRTAAECIDWSLPCPSIFERKRPLAEKTMQRIARGIQKFVIDAEEPFIVTCNHGGDRFRGQGLNEPFCTITAARDAHGLVVPYLTEHANASSQRIFDASEPLRTQCASIKGGHFALISPHLSQQNSRSVGSELDNPITTVTARNKAALAAAFLTKFKGTCRHGQPADAPAPTIQAGGLHVAEVRAFLMKYYGTGGQDQSCADPLHSATTKARFGLVTVAGVEYQISDIGMRMLTPRELARAQGFPDSYILDPIYNGKPLTKTAQIKMIGNSVCPDVAAALFRANLELSARERRADHA